MIRNAKEDLEYLEKDLIVTNNKFDMNTMCKYWIAESEKLQKQVNTISKLYKNNAWALMYACNTLSDEVNCPAKFSLYECSDCNECEDEEFSSDCWRDYFKEEVEKDIKRGNIG